MLKIKDNVDLKELEKFGFKPKYDEDTGEIKQYVYKVMTTNGRTIRGIIITNYYRGTTWEINDIETGFLDKIYDLIQAGLVEKVGD